MTSVLDAAAAGKGLVSAFQQVVSLPSEAVVGYEALARWPSLNSLTPIQVFSHAQRTGKLDLLDSECIRSAARGALAGSSTPGMLLLINCEPATAHAGAFTDSALAEAAEYFHLIFEVTERGLLRDPQALLRKVAAIRSAGFPIALDDVGAEADSLALLDIIAPDIVKLDLRLVQRQPNPVQARTVAAILAYHERTGATILAEGIETEEHLEQALAYGATLGQGYRFGVPGDLAATPGACTWPAWPARSPFAVGQSTFELSTHDLTPRTVRKKVLLELSRHIERLATTAESPPIVLTTLQQQRNLNGRTLTAYAALAEKSSLVALFGRGIPSSLKGRIRGVGLDAGDPLLQEWTIVVLGPDTAAALIAREHSQPGPGLNGEDGDRQFEMVLTFDRARVAVAARSLLSRVAAGAVEGVALRTSR